jgi:hypothetical protein
VKGTQDRKEKRRRVEEEGKNQKSKKQKTEGCIEESVVGSLQKKWGAWKKEGAAVFLVDSVRYGLDFLPDNSTEIMGSHGRPIVLDKSQSEWLEEEIERLVASGGMKDLGVSDTIPPGLDFASAIFLVPKAGPKRFRLVVDMRPINKGLHPPKFKMERIEELVQFACPGWLMFTLDLKEGYFHQLLSERAKRWAGA